MNQSHIKILCTAFLIFICLNFLDGQSNPAITSWLRNTTVKGSYYTSGNSTAVTNNILANCQKVEYSTTSVYITTKGIPSYPTGPFLDGNPSQASDQNAIFKFPLTPTQNTGTATSTGGGNIGLLINGVAIFDYRDGVSWNNAQSKVCGGPIQTCTGDGKWNRDAVVGEKGGFDCSKGHPAMGNYHHHQNPSAFKLDKTVISTVCNLYDADGLYVIDEAKHSPLIGFAYDGFPIYGAYGYKNVDGTGGIVRMKSSYNLRTMTARTTYADGSTVTAGPAVSATYPLGYFKEDYEYLATTAATPDYLDEHNGRFCKTPEYPSGIYCYFATVDANHNSAYPYLVGPTYYGNYANRKATSVTETTTEYKGTSVTGSISNIDKHSNFKLTLSESQDILAVQCTDIIRTNTEIKLYDMSGKLLRTSILNAGQTISYLDTQTLYNGIYIVSISSEGKELSRKIEIRR